MDDVNRIDRRELLKLLGGAGGAALVGASVGRPVWTRLTAVAAPEAAAAANGTSLACILSPAKTEGPFFVDEKLDRSDIRRDATDGTTQVGVPLRLRIVVRDSARACAPVKGATVDIWHANAQGSYSDVAQNGTAGKKFLRGFQTTDASGAAQFTTIYPGWYQGRAIHIHFKVRLYDGARETYEFTSQIFFDEAVNNAVMKAAAYQRGRARDTLNRDDNIYGSDGARLAADASGSIATGYTATFDVGLTGLPASSSRAGSVVAATLASTRFDRAPSGRRRLTLTLDVDEPVSADVRVIRNDRKIARRRFTRLRAGTRRPTLLLPAGVQRGGATVHLTLRDTSGNTKTIRRAIQIPAP
jgi:protocatechuate 3,4-dioxygenase beta subunit